MVPHKLPAPMFRREYMAPKLEHMAARYNVAFDLEEVAERVGYPLYMKPYDGGQWVGVARIADASELHSVYDASGERLMHLQASVEGFDVFVRTLSIGAESMVMHFEPDAPMHERYVVDHDFLSPETGWEVVTISRLVNAFFRWEFNSCETLVRGDRRVPDRLRERLARCRAHEPALLLPVGDRDARQVVPLLRRDRPPDGDRPRAAPLLRDRRPRGPELRGEAARVPAARRRVLRACRRTRSSAPPRCRRCGSS